MTIYTSVDTVFRIMPIILSIYLCLLNMIRYNSNIYFAICFAFESKFSQSSGRCIDLDDDRRTSQNSHHMTLVLLPWSLLRLFSLLQLFFFDMKSMLLLGNWVWATVGITKG